MIEIFGEISVWSPPYNWKSGLGDFGTLYRRLDRRRRNLMKEIDLSHIDEELLSMALANSGYRPAPKPPPEEMKRIRAERDIPEEDVD